MRGGYRKPSIKKSVKARTSGRVTRAAKRSVSPGYGSKGMGWAKDPKKSGYNAVYSRTTKSAYSGSAGSWSDGAEACGCGCGCLFFIILIIWTLLTW